MNSDGQVLGVKYATLLAGFAGGVVSLSFVRRLRPWQAVMAVVVGTITAAFITPGAVVYLTIPQGAESAAAFLIGLTAMNTVPGVIGISAFFRDKPVEVANEALSNHYLGFSVLSAFNLGRRVLGRWLKPRAADDRGPGSR